MTPIQRTLYKTFVKNLIYLQNASNPLRLFAVCCKIWNHPDILYNILQDRKAEAVEDNDLDIELGNIASAGAAGNKINAIRKKRVNKDIGTAGPSISNGYNQETGFSLREKLDSSISYDWATPLMDNYTQGVLENSHKMTVLFAIIEQTVQVDDKLLVFSQSLFTLDLIEKFLNRHPLPLKPGSINSIMGTNKWCRNKNYFRLDGSTSPQEREKLINEFNSNPNINLFLLSTRAGCLGINLIGANRIVVVDASWNPCHDAQAVCRIYRYGQQKLCYIYRLVSDNSLEKRIYDRQVNKQGMSDRVVDELNPESNFTWKEVTTLIHDNEQDNAVQDLSVHASKYNDHVLRYLCLEKSECLSKEPFQHESLLCDRKELKLTRQEKRLAKQSYEMEKRANMTGNYNRPLYTSVYPGNLPLGNNTFNNFQGTNTRAPPWMSANTSLLPSQPTPLPMQPIGPSPMNQLHTRSLPSHIIQNLMRQGVTVQHLTVPSAENQTTAKLFEPSAARSQQCIGIVQQSLQCGGTVQYVPPTPNVPNNRPPEVIDLSDDSDQGEVVITNEVLPTDKPETETPPSNAPAEWPETSTVSSTPYDYNQQTERQTHIPSEVDTSCGVG